ncbi:MAG: ATP-binding protein [Thermodesulfobacteriota bacterium]
MAAVRISLRFKITVLCFLLALAGIAAATWFSYRQTAESLHLRARQRISALQAGDIQQFHTAFTGIKEDLLFLMGSGPVSRLIEPGQGAAAGAGGQPGPPFWRERLAGLFEVILRQQKNYRMLLFLDTRPEIPAATAALRRDGRILARSAAELDAVLASPEWRTLVAATGRLPAGTVHAAPLNSGGQRSLVYAVPLSGGGDIGGLYLFIETELASLASSCLPAADERPLFLADRDGGFILQLTAGLTAPQTLLTPDGRLDTAAFPPEFAAGGEEILLHDEEGLLALRAVAVPDSDGYFLVLGRGVTTREMDREIVTFRNRLLVSLVLVAAAVCLVAFFLGGYLTRPVRLLTETARRITANEAVEEFPDIRGRDETGELAEAFRRMLTELDERSNKLTLAYRELLHHDKLSAVGMLSASIAHEFGNPIFAIRNMLLGLQQDPSTADPQTIALAIEECDRLRGFLLTLKDFSNPTSGAMEYVELHELLDKVLHLFRRLLHNRSIEIVTRYAPSLPLVLGVADQLKQVVLNLLLNAEKAIDGPGTITIRTLVMDGRVHLQVEDTGRGIPAENLEKIFIPFFTTGGRREGSGLGLSISSDIIRQHGGEITVRSKEGKGSIFTVILPLPAG